MLVFFQGYPKCLSAVWLAAFRTPGERRKNSGERRANTVRILANAAAIFGADTAPEKQQGAKSIRRSALWSKSCRGSCLLVMKKRRPARKALPSGFGFTEIS